MSECKHGMKSGCSYCHVTISKTPVPAAASKRRTRSGAMSEKMNDRMTALKQRLRKIRGE
ncbi:MAG TPA: hypothetical protein VGD07_08600 [Methylomirabilota bacterium]